MLQANLKLTCCSDGGVGITLKLNNKSVCTSEAIYGDGEVVSNQLAEKWVTIKDMTYCPNPIKITKGDTVSIEAVYDFDKHPRYVVHITEMRVKF
jgi:hypothetical protein